MAYESVCEECGRVVGAVRAPATGGPARWKVAVHAAAPRVGWDRARRARCPGTGRERLLGQLVKTTDSPQRRRERERLGRGQGMV